MAESITNEGSVKYVTNRSWWAPAFGLIPFLIQYVHTNPTLWRWLIAAVVDLALWFVPYVLTHPTLTYSPQVIAQRRGPFRSSIELDALESVRVSTVSRQNAVMDPLTGERRSVIRWYRKYPDDWAGKPPVTSISMRDQRGSHLTLSVLRTDVDRWGRYLYGAIKGHPEVELGPRVTEALESLTR